MIESATATKSDYVSDERLEHTNRKQSNSAALSSDSLQSSDTIEAGIEETSREVTSPVTYTSAALASKSSRPLLARYPGDDHVKSLSKEHLADLIRTFRTMETPLTAIQIRCVRRQYAEVVKREARKPFSILSQSKRSSLPDTAKGRWKFLGLHALTLSPTWQKRLTLQILFKASDRSPEVNLEATAAHALRSSVLRLGRVFTRKLPPGGAYEMETLGESDIETSAAIVEVTTAKGDKLAQVRDRLLHPPVNEFGKPVLIYAPHYTYSQEEPLNKIGAVVARTIDELQRYHNALAQK